MKTQSIIRSALVAIVALGTAVSVTAPASAQENVVQAHVPLHGLNLADAADRRLIARQIRSAARQICSSGEGEVLIQQQAERRCYREAMKSGNAQLAGIQARGGTTFAALAPAARTAFPR
jgi:UrcA family protein